MAVSTLTDAREQLIQHLLNHGHNDGFIETDKLLDELQRAAFERGARAMAEKCAARLEEDDMDRMAGRLRFLPLPEFER